MTVVHQERVQGPTEEPGVFAACAVCLVNLFKTPTVDNSAEMSADFLATEHQKKNPLHLIVVGVVHAITGK